MENGKRLGNQLYTLRKQKGLSQEELAEKLGVSRQAVSKWECGESLPDTDNLITIARLFEVSLDTLVGNVQESPESSKPKIEVKFAESDNDDDRDDEDFDSNFDDEVFQDTPHTEKKKSLLMRVLWALPYPILTTVAFFLWGALGNAWHIAWTLFITIPVYYSILECIRSRRFSPFAYPVFAAFLYLLIGMVWGVWHPTWVIFITIPIYYPIAEAIDRR